jgi:serine/threonine protein kinase
MPEINEVLQQGRYRIVNHLGQNGAGQLYEAYDNARSANVLLREIPVKLNKVTTPAQMETLKLAFAGEAGSLAEIKHPSFVHVQGYFSEIDRHYLVMDLADGDYLSDLLEKRKTAFSLSEMTGWADQLLDALNYLHSQAPPVIHRDLRPQNIKLTSDGRIKLLALGISKNGETRANAVIANQSFDTATLNYLPLEQIWGKLDSASQKVIANSYTENSVDVLMQAPDARSDIYGLGATLYHLVTARRPVDALERSIDLLEGKADPLPIPSKLNPNIPPEVSYVLMKAMDIKRENRFDSAIMMRQVLRTAIVRVKEREAKEGKQAEVPAPMIPVAELKRPEIVDDPAIHTTADAEADLNRQLEQIKNRLREAEAQKLKAEQRAAEAEKLLREKEAHEVVAYASPEESVLDIPLAAPSLGGSRNKKEETVAVLDIPLAADIKIGAGEVKKNSSPAGKETAAKETGKETAAKEFEFSFAEETQEKSGAWKVLAAAAAVVVFAGAGLGIWSLNASKSSQGQPVSAPVMSLSDTAKPAAVSEPAPAQSTESAPAIQTAQETPVSQAEQTLSVVETAAPGRKAAAPSAAQLAAQAAQKEKEKKQPVQTAKAAPAQKKAVTVDDLINDH